MREKSGNYDLRQLLNSSWIVNKTMESEDIFEEDFSEDIINDIDREYAADDADEEEEIAEEIVEDTHNTTEIENDAEHNSETVSRRKANEAEDTEHANVELSANTKNAQQSKLFQLPLTRVRNLMKLDPDLHIASNEAVFGVTRATELFIESLARESYFYTAQSKKKTIQKRDVDMAIAAVDSLMFLDGAMNF